MHPPLATTPLAHWRPTLIARVSILAVLGVADKLFLNSFVDFERAQTAQGIGAAVRVAQHWGFRFLAAFAAAVVLFAAVRSGTALRAAAESVRAAPTRTRYLLAHLALIALLALPSYALYRATPNGLTTAAVAAAWIIAAGGASLAAMRWLAPASAWRELARALGSIWGYAALAALAGMAAMQVTQQLWAPTAALTFELVRLVLTPMLPSLAADPSTLILSTDSFAVQVAEVCSGLEGVGLVLAFTSAWLLYFRHEYRFPQALLLIPLGMLIIYGFNILRISMLVLIGDAGYPEIAVYGFHSQAGWIAFIAVSCGLVFVSRRSAWLHRSADSAGAAASGHAGATENATAVYLMPLLAILAAALVSNALSGRFEFLYPLRLIAAAITLWAYRKPLRLIDWRCSWRGLFIGFCVFAIWMGGAHRLLPAKGMPDALAAMSPAVRGTWIACRLAASVLTVPVAEELAYRGFLMRRLITREFDALPYTAVRWPAVCASAVLFGLMHGTLWLPASLAGLAYGFLLVRRGRLGEAIAAHATTNALLAGAVLWGDQWQLW